MKCPYCRAITNENKCPICKAAIPVPVREKFTENKEKEYKKQEEK